MTNDERQRTMDFILAQQAQFEVNFDKADVRVARLERVVKLIIKAGLRARVLMREQDERSERSFAALRETQANSDRRLDALTESQAHSDKRLDALIDIIREQQNGKS